MKAPLFFVAALVAVAVVHGQPEESTTAAINSEEQPSATIPAVRTLVAASYAEEDEDTICVQADNKFYLYANSLKLYSCYHLLPKVYVVKPKSLCKPVLSDCPKN
ncbi:uncharacterized protein LOC124595924 [Schistocerca americana]|uniref:uncharacterized protein LOC124595924 n=1 Tax=Schistocerca americana TaxID=7009 RepID=UPI001F4F9838|nr:uncharacterized protein LOC124595924 [Schistocerca americana]XP_049950189.1 uncharacterized protein LOC126457704 isoform X1 [Schistocerca serialis cubense]XP_049950190.1 uncharacterized protein LOC126457704 isoform X2 [Schistocerca serialis cubense]